MTAPTCPDCGTALPADSPQSLCPACLLRQALASRTLVHDDVRNPSKPPPTPEEIADKFPQFEVLECLGRGGMGVVYKARQKSLNRLVAIKILAPDREHEPRFAGRFAREAELLARLNHPHIVTIHDFGETGGLFYLVMEFVDGVNLRDLLRDGKLEPKQALAIVPPICEALQYAHDKGIVHRDIKPENLLLDRDGRIKIADFGIAALMGDGGEISGTPAYMAPEQGGSSEAIDHRADLYALGVVLYEMLTGERPGKDLVAPSRKVRIDVRLDEMVLRALEKEPERRYQTAGEFRTVVETLQASPPVPAAAPPMPVEAAKAPGAFRRFWWLFLVMPPACMLLGLGFGFLWTYLAPKVYEARTLVQFGESVGTTQPTAWVTWAEALRSRESLQQVCERLDLDQRWMLPEERAVAKLRTLFEVRQIRGTDLLELRVRHTDPTDAAAIANELLAVDQARADEANVTRRIIVHQEAVPPGHPVSPILRLVLAISAGAGFLLSPLAALLLILFLGRAGRGRKRPSGRRRPGILAICIAAGTLLIAIFGIQKIGRSFAPEEDKVLLGRAKFDFEIPEAFNGWGAELPVFKGQDNRWFPSDGQPVRLKDGRTLYLRVLTMAPPNAPPRLWVGLSENGTDWLSQHAEMEWAPGLVSMNLSHGVKATLRWTPLPGQTTESRPNPGLTITARTLVLIVPILLLVVVGGIVVVFLFARSKRSAGAKVAGIGCTVLLLGALVAGLAALVINSMYHRERTGVARMEAEETAARERVMSRIEAETRTDVVAPVLTVRVHGAVARAGQYTLRPGATLLEAVAAAGGWTERAKPAEVYLTSGDDDAKHDLLGILHGGAPNPILKAGDSVFVARR